MKTNTVINSGLIVNVFSCDVSHTHNNYDVVMNNNNFDFT